MKKWPWTHCHLHLKNQQGIGDYSLTLSWALDERDASMWRRPLSLTICPADENAPEQWETVLDLTREEGRLLRDFLTTLLASPDLRDTDAGVVTLDGVPIVLDNPG